MSCWALVPFKALHLAKQRLAPVLRPPQRQRLAETMLQHVLDTLALARMVDHVAITSPQPCAQASLADATWLPDRAGELNAAVEQAVQQIWQRGATELIVLHGDLPELCVADLQALQAAGQATGLALAPDRYGTGTNALYLQRGHDWAFNFGPGSCQRHLQQAAARGYDAALVQRGGFARDIDAPGELALWNASHTPTYPHAATGFVPYSRSLSWQRPQQTQTV